MQFDSEPYDRHWIRLRGPWDVSSVAESGTDSVERVRLPADWRTLFGEQTGTACFQRRFQCPTHLDDDERVCVTLLDVRAQVHCQLNGQDVPPLAAPLGDPGCWPAESCLSFDLTDLLQPSNQLRLALTVEQLPADPVGLHEPVLLEIVTLDPDAGD